MTQLMRGARAARNHDVRSDRSGQGRHRPLPTHADTYLIMDPV
jgi:hypothetical protein